MNLVTFLLAAGLFNIEDNSWQTPKQNLRRKEFLKDPQVKNILEIGFGAGYLSELLLEANSEIKIVSFDRGDKPYTQKAKEYIDTTFPGRHTLILGNTVDKLAEFIRDNCGVKFDLIYYDDRDDYGFVKPNLDAAFQVAHENTLIIANNARSVQPQHLSHLYLHQAWHEVVAEGKIIEIGRKNYDLENRII